MARTFNIGYPRIGPRRELKRALEGYWRGTQSAAHLQRAAAIRSANWRSQRAAGIDIIPSNDFSLCDHVLDTIALVGAVPPIRLGRGDGRPRLLFRDGPRWR